MISALKRKQRLFSGVLKMLSHPPAVTFSGDLAAAPAFLTLGKPGGEAGGREGGKEAGANGLPTQEGTSPSSPGPRTARSLLSCCCF